MRPVESECREQGEPCGGGLRARSPSLTLQAPESLHCLSIPLPHNFLSLSLSVSHPASAAPLLTHKALTMPGFLLLQEAKCFLTPSLLHKLLPPPSVAMASSCSSFRASSNIISSRKSSLNTSSCVALPQLISVLSPCLLPSWH